MWSYLIGILFFDDKEKRILYFIGFVLIIIGVIIFNLYEKKMIDINIADRIDVNIESETNKDLDIEKSDTKDTLIEKQL